MTNSVSKRPNSTASAASLHQGSGFIVDLELIAIVSSGKLRILEALYPGVSDQKHMHLVVEQGEFIDQRAPEIQRPRTTAGQNATPYNPKPRPAK